MTRMTTAERRGYQQICGDDGAMMVIACDQRGGMRSLLASDPEAQKAIGNDVLGDTKADITRYLASQASCVLVDPICAVPQLVDDGVLDRQTALLIGLDASGWDVSPEGYRLSNMVEGITARRVRELGGTGGKIMIYLRSDTPAANVQNLAILDAVIADFAREDLLLVVEFLTYQLEGETKEAYAARTAELIEGGSRLCLEHGAKVLKIPYPGLGGGLRRDHAARGRRALGGAVGGRRPRDLPRPGGDRHGERRLGRHRRTIALEGLHLARPRGDARAARDRRRPAAARDPGGDRQAPASAYAA